ncbi:HEPN domain-containing protein [Solwaraspora sp. WMMB335]|uniref:HEPN domain-containing protein n=1 Tax=Solwaraspora sp. WMMB335 TaxID=3404118 RepID=UPI003B941971
MPTVIAWPSLTIQNLDRGLSRVASLVERPSPNEPDDVTRALARFLIIRTCGHLEKTVQECLRAYVENKSFGRIKLFSHSWLARMNNPEPERLLELVGRFDPGLQSDLRALFEANDFELKREISLLIDKRNAIAHGESEGIGSRKALSLLEHSRTLTDWFILNFDPR